MKILSFKGVFFALLFSTHLLFAKQIVINDDKILSENVSEKITAIGSELMSKSGVFVGLGVYEGLNGKGMVEFVKGLDLKPPYAFLLLSKKEHVVEIFADEQTASLFDRGQILSPYPAKGSILPILSLKNGKDIYNASMLNGYADLAEQIAQSKGIKLQNAVGSQNKFVLDGIRLVVYGFLAIAVFMIFWKKFRRKNG